MSRTTGHGGDPDTPFHPCPPDPACAYCRGTPPTGSAAFDWSFVDRAYCISLASRPDRAASAAAAFHQVGLCRTIVFYRPAKHPTMPKVGIWESHRAVALDALARGAGTALVFEDDLRFARGVTPRRVRSVGAALAGLPAGWRIFFLGHWPLRAWFVRRQVLRCASACAHAYVASRGLLEWLRDHPFGTAPIVRVAGASIDAAYAALPDTFAYFPMLVTQTGSPSDHVTHDPARRIKKLKHLVSRSRHRDRLLARAMRPNELAIAALSPWFYLLDRLGRPIRTQPPKGPLPAPGADGP